MKKILLIFIALLTLFSKSEAQNISNKGTEFWTSFPHNASFEVYTGWIDTPKLSFVFSAEIDAKVNIFIQGTSYKQEISVPAGTVIRSANMPLGERNTPGSPYNAMLVSRLSTFPGGTNSEGIFKNKAIHITSDVPVTCTQQLVQKAASYAAMLCPVDSWGYSYKVLTSDQTINVKVPQPGNANNQSTNNLLGYPRFAFVNILAHYDNTKIRFTPSHETRSGLPANVPIEIVLNKGEVYQSLANVTLDTYKNSNDFINSMVVSIANSDGVCLPFMVSVGSSDNYTKCDFDPFKDVNNGGGYYPEDPAFQQLFPVEAWGRRYVTIPSSNYNNPSVLNQNLFRVMPKDPTNTIVKRNGVVLVGLTKGYYEFRSNTADYIEADNPIQVLQIFPTQGACGYEGVGDPEMFFLSPIEQGVKKTAFLRTNKANIDYNYMSLCIPTIGIASLKIDGKLNNYTSAFPHPNLPGYSIVLRNWHTRSNTDVRPETMCTVECDTTFIGSSYGFGDAESYSLNVGTYINNLSGYPKIKNSYNDGDTTNFYACVNSPVDLYISLRYEPTKIIAQFTKSNADIINPKDIVINNPKYVSIDDIYGVPYYRYKIMDSVRFSTPGIKDLLVFASNPKVEQCDNTEKIPYKIEIKDAIHAGFDFTLLNCRNQETVEFTGNEKFHNGEDVKKWNWTFYNGTNVTTGNGQKISSTFNLGEDSTRLIAVDFVGCISDSVRTFKLSDKPTTPDFDITAVNTCVGTEISFTEKGNEAGVKTWYWNLGDGNPLNLTTNGTSVKKTYTTAGEYTIKHVVKFSDNCISDTAFGKITVFATPVVDFTNDAGSCIDESGLVNFVPTVSSSDNQAVATYAWNFGDANANTGNPNTSTAAKPSHSFAPGKYKVQLIVTTVNGCTNQIEKEINLSGKPKLSFNHVFTPVCADAAPVNIDFATLTNTVTGTGEYKGPGVNNTAKTFDPKVAGAGTHTIMYIFKTNEGCADTVYNTIKVNVLPQAQFSTTTTDFCVNQNYTFTNESTIDNSKDTESKIAKWIWNFDGVTTEYTNGNAITRSLDKTQTVTLKVVTDKGCESSVYSKNINVRELPVVDFDMPRGICMPNGIGVFTNKSTPVENAYTWTIDGKVYTTTNMEHVFTDIKDYPVKLKAVTTYGCQAELTRTLDKAVFLSGPDIAFTASDINPCQNSTIELKSSVLNSVVVKSWQWDFGNGTTSTQANPSVRYTRSGTYTITLKATDEIGCVTNIPVSQEIKVQVLPVISAGKDRVVEFGTTIQLEGTTGNNLSEISLLWTPAGLLNNPAILTPSYLANGEQTFVLTATNKDGNCEVTDDVLIRVQRTVSKVPNAFSPNGDGINDYWVIENLSDYPYCKVQVFSRQGQLVYSSIGYSRPWDGTKNGKPLPVGTYYYIITVKDGEPPLQGSVTLLR